MFQAREYMAQLRQILGRAQSPAEESQAKRKKGMSFSSLGKEEELEDVKGSEVDEKELMDSTKDNMEISSVVTGETAPSNESGKKFFFTELLLKLFIRGILKNYRKEVSRRVLEGL